MAGLHRKPILDYGRLQQLTSDQRLLLTGLAAVMIIRWAIILAPGIYGGVVFIVCLAFTGLFFGLGGLSVALLRKRREERDVLDRGGDGRESVRIFTGDMPRTEVRVQLLIVPAAVSIGFLALALVFFFDRLVMIG